MYTLFPNTSWTETKILPCVSHGLCWFPDSLISHLHLNCDPTAHRSSLAPTTSIRAQLLPPTTTVSIRTQLLVSSPNSVHSSPNARHPPQPELEPSLLSSTVSNRAQLLVSDLCRLELTPNAHIPPLPCQSECNCSPPTSILSIPSSQFKPERSLPASTMSIRA